ncbi:MAG: hypothetical protein ACK55Z_26065, partial [bacterium]
QVVSFFRFLLKKHRLIFIKCLNKRRKKLVSFDFLLEVAIEVVGVLTRRQCVVVDLVETFGLCGCLGLF